MSQAEPGPKPEPTCRECGATNDPGASECWLCHRADWFADGAKASAKTGVPRGGGRSRWPIAGIMVVGVILLVGAGMALDLWNLDYSGSFSFP